MTTLEAARGKWKGILEHFGVDPKHLKNEHGPCPLCMGVDRFRFDDLRGDGTYYCNGCGPGNGINLLMIFREWDFITACKEVEAMIGNVKGEAIREERTEEEKREAIKRVLLSARKITQGDPVWMYLRNRCGEPDFETIKDLRYHPGMIHPGDGQKYPCMLSMLRYPDKTGATVQRLFLLGDGQKANVNPSRMLMPGKIKTASVMLGTPGECLGIAEGIETALCASKLFNMPVWSAIAANNLVAWEPPEGVSSFVVFGDNDANYTGHAAAYTLARRLVMAGKKAEVCIPPTQGQDWCDVFAFESRASV